MVVRRWGWDGLAHLVSTAKSFELGGHMGYQNNPLDERYKLGTTMVFGTPQLKVGAVSAENREGSPLLIW